MPAAGELVPVEFGRFPPRNGQALPGGAFQHLAQEHDLPHMVGVMPELPVDGLRNGVGLVADVYLPAEIFRSDAFQNVKQAVPARFPFFQQFLPGTDHVFKLEVPLARAFPRHSTENRSTVKAYCPTGGSR